MLLFSRLAAIVSGAWLGDPLLAIIIFSGVSSLCYVGLLFLLAKIARSDLIK